MTTILKPGLLVSLHTEVKGGVAYARRDREGKLLDGKTKVDEWETVRTISDKDDYERAIKTRSTARNVISRVCTPSQFGLLCPTDKEAALDAAVRDARQRCDEHNKTATTTSVGVYVLKGRIAATDEEATRALAAEVRGLLTDMREGTLVGDIERVRDAATKAKKLSTVLGDAEAKAVSDAVSAAREAAKEIVKRVKVGSESLAKVLTEVRLDALDSSRFAFLDVEEPLEAVESLPVAVRAIDMDDEDEPARRDDTNEDESQVLAAQGAFSRFGG